MHNTRILTIKFILILFSFLNANYNHGYNSSVKQFDYYDSIYTKATNLIKNDKLEKSIMLLKEIILGKVASISFGGWASEKNANFYTEQLTKYLKLNNYETIGSFMVAQYNSPWAIPPFRKNEILVKIN